MGDHRGGVRESHGLIFATRGDHLPVGDEGDGGHPLVAALESEALPPGWAPEQASQSLTVLSRLPEAIISPSGLKATEVALLLWPSRGSHPGARGGVQEPHGVIFATRGDHLLVGVEGDGMKSPCCRGPREALQLGRPRRRPRASRRYLRCMRRSSYRQG